LLEKNRFLARDGDLLVRLTLILVGVTLIYIGYATWNRGEIYAHHEIAVLSMVLYILGFCSLLLSAISCRKFTRLLEKNRFLARDRDLLVRLALIIVGVILIYVGYATWNSGEIYAHHEIVVLSIPLYILGFCSLVPSAINCRKFIEFEYIRYFILFALLFCLIIWTYTYSQVLSPGYGTDAMAFNHYSAQRVLEGKNPYQYSMAPAIEMFNFPKQFITLNTDGTSIDRTPHPALSFLIYVPFVVVGLSDMRWVTLLFHMAVLLIIFYKAPKSLKPLILLPLFLPDMLDYTGGAVTDFLWVLPLVLMVLYIDDIRKSGIFFGLTCAFKPTAVIFAPFLLVWYWKTGATPNFKKQFVKITKFFSISAAAFLIPNLPFLLSDFSAWVHGALAPIFGNMIPFGSGLSSASQIGMVALPKIFFTTCMILVTLTLVLNYWVYFDRMKYAIWIFPAIILWFSHRSLHSYFIYFTPLLLISLCLWHDKMRKGEGTEKRPSRRTKTILGFNYRRFVAPVSLATCVSLMFVFGFAFRSQEKLSVEVTGEIKDTENIDRVSELAVNVVNDGPIPVEPKFSIIGCEGGTFTFYWIIENGPKYLESKSSATYLIHAETWETAIVDGRIFVVRVNDAPSSAYFVSNPIRVKLENSASNPA